MATATNPNLHARTLDPLERVRVRNFAYSRGPRLKRTKASRGRKRQKRRRKRDTGFPAVLHSWGRMNGRPLHARTRIKLVPERKRAATRGLDVSARDLHWMASCHVGVWTSIHARSGRIKASHVQFHGTKIFFRGISILLPLHAWNLCLVPSWTWLSDFHAFPCRRVLICNTMHGEARARHTRIDIGYLVWLVTTAARDEWQWGETMILTRKM